MVLCMQEENITIPEIAEQIGITERGLKNRYQNLKRMVKLSVLAQIKAVTGRYLNE